MKGHDLHSWPRLRSGSPAPWFWSRSRLMPQEGAGSARSLPPTGRKSWAVDVRKPALGEDLGDRVHLAKSTSPQLRRLLARPGNAALMITMLVLDPAGWSWSERCASLGGLALLRRCESAVRRPSVAFRDPSTLLVFAVSVSSLFDQFHHGLQRCPSWRFEWRRKWHLQDPCSASSEGQPHYLQSRRLVAFNPAPRLGAPGSRRPLHATGGQGDTGRSTPSTVLP